MANNICGDTRNDHARGRKITVPGAAIGGVAAGVKTIIARKLIVHAPTALAGDRDEALTAEHDATLKLFDALQATDDRGAHKQSAMLIQLKHTLAKHAFEEKSTIYPALREAGYAEDADELNIECGYVKRYLYQPKTRPMTAPTF